MSFLEFLITFLESGCIWNGYVMYIVMNIIEYILRPPMAGWAWSGDWAGHLDQLTWNVTSCTQLMYVYKLQLFPSDTDDTDQVTGLGVLISSYGMWLVEEVTQ